MVTEMFYLQRSMTIKIDSINDVRITIVNNIFDGRE